MVTLALLSLGALDLKMTRLMGTSDTNQIQIEFNLPSWWHFYVTVSLVLKSDGNIKVVDHCGSKAIFSFDK